MCSRKKEDLIKNQKRNELLQRHYNELQFIKQSNEEDLLTITNISTTSLDKRTIVEEHQNNFKEIFLSDLKLNEIHTNCYIKLRTIATAGKYNATFTVVEDLFRDVTTLYIYHFVPFSSYHSDLSSYLPIGSYFSLFNPFFKSGFDFF